MPEQAIQYQFGPYYESAIRRQLPQREAIGQAPLSAAELAGISQGELAARYQTEQVRSREATRAMEVQQQYGMQRRAEERQEKASTVSGISQIAGGTLGSLALASQIPVTAATPAIAGTIGGEGIAAATAGTSLLEAGAGVVGGAASYAWTSLLALLGLCCFIFIEGEGEVTETVRRYRDEHYLNTPVAWGYKKMASWLVPLMKRSRLIKNIIRYSMTKPLGKYADWYYGKNHYGWIFTPNKLFWVGIWDIYGRRCLAWQVG